MNQRQIDKFFDYLDFMKNTLVDIEEELKGIKDKLKQIESDTDSIEYHVRTGKR